MNQVQQHERSQRADYADARGQRKNARQPGVSRKVTLMGIHAHD
jgi:hypothetical protein